MRIIKAIYIILILLIERLKGIMERIQGLDISNSESLRKLNLNSERSVHYVSSGNKYLDNVMQSFKITSEDSIIDVGCGKGGALITMSKYPFASLCGVELSYRLCNIAKMNMNRLGIENVKIYCSDASEFTDYYKYNYIYFFNPFPSVVMNLVMQNVINDLQINPRKVVIIYKNPVCHEDIINNSIFFKIQEFPHEGRTKFFVYSNTVG